MSTTIYDSHDPNHPSLPNLDIIDDSSCDEYNFSEGDTSDLSSSSSSSESELESEPPVPSTTAANHGKRSTNHLKKRKVSFFGVHDSSSSSTVQVTPSQVAPFEHKLPTTEPNNLKLQELQQKRNQRQKRKARKYHDSQTSSSSARLRANWEPGVTPTTNVSLHSIGSAITITDYDEQRYRVEHIEIPTLSETGDQADEQLLSQVSELSDKLNQILESRPEWSKVRWVSVNGLSWELISLISKSFQLHRLSIEDMIDIPQRTKVDQYANYTMCILPLVKLIKLKRDFNNLKFSERLLGVQNDYDDLETLKEEEEERELKNDKHKKRKRRPKSITEQINDREMRRMSDWSSDITSRRKIRLLEVHRPLSYRNLSVGVEQVSLFILKGTVISFFENSATDIESAILTRLGADDTILRDSCDASILLQSIIDSVVDLLYPIVTLYRRRLEEVQLDILTDAKIGNINELYLMLDELSLLKKSISPLTTLVYALRDHSKRLAQNVANSSTESMADKKNSSIAIRPIFISETCDLYLSDVADHTQSYTEDITIMESMVNNLTSLVFNITLAQSNNSMSYLSLVSVIFLPLMFWSSYYGMNFEKFGDLHKSVNYYWKVSISFTVVFIVIICWRYFYRFVKSWFKFLKRWRREYVIYKEVQRRKQLKLLRQQRRRKNRQERQHKHKLSIV